MQPNKPAGYREEERDRYYSNPVAVEKNYLQNRGAAIMNEPRNYY